MQKQMSLATATDLSRWSDLREAQAMLPQLVRRLIASTAKGLTALSARAGEGVALTGWDGIADAEQADAHVPAGKSVWEMGVSADVTAKASEDYRKRSDAPIDVDPAVTTFVFVTPRRWSSKHDDVTEEGRSF
jgi:hypothetical protein